MVILQYNFVKVFCAMIKFIDSETWNLVFIKAHYWYATPTFAIEALCFNTTL